MSRHTFPFQVLVETERLCIPNPVISLIGSKASHQTSLPNCEVYTGQGAVSLLKTVRRIKELREGSCFSSTTGEQYAN